MGYISRAVIGSAASLLLLWSGGASAQFAGYKTVPVADKVIIENGGSFNYATLETGLSCIKWSAVINNSKRFGAAEFNDNLRIDSSTDIASSLSVSYRSMFKALSSSDSLEVSISNELHYSEDKMTWLFRARKSKLATMIDDKTVTLRSDVPTDPDAFRQRCGDYYVAGYATASTFYGVFELDRTAFDSNTNLDVKAEESVNELIASGSESTEVKAALKTAFSNKQAHVVERSSGSGNDQSLRATDLDGLLADFKSYKGDSPAPVTIILAPYPQHGGTILSAYETVMEDNAKLWFDYRTVLDLADQALATPETFYALLPDGHSRWNKSDIQTIRSAIAGLQARVADGIAACGQDHSACVSLRGKLASGTSPDEEEARLPKFLAWPDDCASISRSVPGAPDGDYQLFYQHLPANRYSAFCRNMAVSPITYLKLAFTQAPDSGNSIHGSNYSQSAPNDHWGGTKVTTLWRGIAIDPKSLRVDRCNYAMAVSDGGDIKKDSGDDITSTPYAEAAECDGHSDKGGLALANLDLRQTHFQVDQDLSKMGSGYYDGKSEYAANDGVVVSNGGQVVDFTSHFGYCATTLAEPLYLKVAASGAR